MTALVRADVLKLVRRRSLVAWSVLLTTGLVLLFYAWRAVQHLQPLGGTHSLTNLMEGLLLLGGVAAIMIGSTAGAGDAAAGVLRDLVATGRPRVQLFASRVPAVLVVAVPLAVVAGVLAGIGSIVLAGSAPAPSVATVVRDAAWLSGTYATLGVVACGVSCVLGSQAISIGLLLGFHIAASHLLIQATPLGDARWALPLAAMDRLQPDASPFFPAMPVGLAVVVLIAWALASAAAGAWRTVRADV